MKNTLLAIVSIVSFGAYAQEEKPADTPLFTCKDAMKFDKDTKTITLTEDASYKDGIIEITGAEKIVLDQVNKEVIVTGHYDFTIDGAVQVASGEGLKKLRYKVGEAVAYIE